MAYESKFKSAATDALFEAILKLENVDECYRFFDDLMTIKEIQSVAQRWEVATLLAEGNTYQEIEKKTKASTATISRINKCMQYGADGYKIVLDRLK
ncbi:MAG: YerC/YecD family TrpR-related protein [Clostridia bacterium]|nr:YerC/YecD family TrpR-related protein [Clostridia bacterium]